MMHPRIDDLLAERRRLALRARDRGGQARAADQQLPPPARRGHVRRLPAAARRVQLEELPDDGPRRRSPRARSPSPVLVAVGRRGPAVARLLLGVTGSIAAYKACELSGYSSGRATRSSRPDARRRAVRLRARRSRRSPAASRPASSTRTCSRPTSSPSRPSRRTRWRSSRTGSPTPCWPRRRSPSAARSSSRPR